MTHRRTAGAVDLYAALARDTDESAAGSAVGTYETKQVESQDEDDATALLGRQGL